jgi:hypothetical protein
MYWRLALIMALTLVAACTSQKSGANSAAATPGPAVSVAPAAAEPAYAAGSTDGQVLAAQAPIAKSSVTLWAATSHAPKQVAQTQTGDDGSLQ